MSFLNPLFVLGVLAAAVPILLHLVRREHAKRIEFPTLMFLRRISRKTIRYQKLRHLLLLLLRVLALVLVALAFMRPYLDGDRSSAAVQKHAKAHILLLDNSMSMAYENRWERARKAAADILKKMDTGDRCAVLEFSDTVLVRTPLSDDAAGALAQIEKGIDLSDRATRYGQALSAASKLALEAGAGKRILYLISDFQKSGFSSEEQEFRLGAGLELKAIDVGSEDFTNLAIRDVRIAEPESGSGTVVKASIANFGGQDRRNVPATLFWDGRAISEKRLDIARGETQALEFPLPGLASGSHTTVVEIEDPHLKRDNRFYLALDAREKTPVQIVEDPKTRGSRSPAFFLTKALDAGALSPYRPEVVAPQNINASARLLIWNNLPGGNSAVQQRVRDIVSSGGGLILVLGDSIQPDDFNRTFGSWLPVRLNEAAATARVGRNRPAEQYNLMTDIRIDHPIFKPFGKPHSGTFANARFFAHAKISVGAEAEILAGFDNGDSALVSAGYGKGRVLIFASSADDVSNDLPLKAVYAPFWQQMLRYLEQFREQRYWVNVGDIIHPREWLQSLALRQPKINPDRNEAVAMLDPQKNRVASDSDLAVLERSGFYEIRTMGLKAAVAANILPRESDLSPGNAEEMVAGWTSFNGDAYLEEEPLLPEERERDRHLWVFLLIGAALFLAAESYLSNFRFAGDDLQLNTGAKDGSSPEARHGA